MTQDEAKRMAARRAVEFVEDGMLLGLGSGTTSTMFIQELGERVKQGLRVRGIATSIASQQLAESLSIPITNFEESPVLDLAIDGADEVGPGLALIKGGGGALLREKIVASASRKFIVIADSTKLVPHLGRFPLPVEVIKMALPVVTRKFEALGLNPKLRHRPDGSNYITDEGNYIVDCSCGEITDPAKTAAEIRGVAGVVEHGLFLGMASLALIASDQGVTKIGKLYGDRYNKAISRLAS
jgi:ribose 5-phosphate isomerase A